VTIHVNQYPIKTYPSLIENWTDLFARAKTNVFLAPTWLEAWIAQAPDSLLVVEARHNTQVVGQSTPSAPSM
jgi:CelD/BcsL family acetyltransferase involved in cellulose biosynthesis